MGKLDAHVTSQGLAAIIPAAGRKEYVSANESSITQAQYEAGGQAYDDRVQNGR